MLLCRQRRLSDSVYAKTDRRRYSTATAAAEVSSNIDVSSNLSTNSSLIQDLSTTSASNHYLQLVLHDEAPESLSRLRTSIESGGKETQTNEGRVIRFNGKIDPIRALTAALKADRHLPDEQSSLEESLVSRGTPNSLGIAWEAMLTKLNLRTPAQRPSHEAVRLKGGENDIFELYYALNLDPSYELMIESPIIQLGTGQMVMQGSKRGIEAALAYVERAAMDVVIERGRSRRDYQVARRVRLLAPARRLSDVPRPSIWTRRSLAQHVEALLLTRPPVVLRGQSQSQGEAKEDALSNILDLLQAPEVRPFLSWTVFQLVMSFVMKQRKTNEAWSLLALMEELGFHPHAPFYNPMLLACAQDQTPDIFEGVLDTMHNQRVRPDAGTWVALLISHMTVGFKHRVMRNMADRGLSARSAFDGELAPVVIGFSFSNFLSTGGSVADFLDILDDIWGPTWFSDGAVSQLVDVIASRGDIIRAVRLADHLKQTRNYQPTKTSLHAMLKHCKRTKSMELAVWLVTYASEHWRVAARDHITFEWLFQMAWQSKMFNLLRVVWVYVTCAGQATFDMRKDMKQSLDDRLQPEEHSVAMRWKSAVGCVACGADPLLDGRPTADIIASDLARFEKVMPKKPFVTSLIEAMLIDKEWSESMSKHTRGTTWKRVNAIKVELTPAEPKSRKTISSTSLVETKSVIYARHLARRRKQGGLRAKRVKHFRTSL